MISDALDLDATAVLSAAEDLTRDLREREVDVLRLVLQWADLHGDDPGEGHALGSDQLIDFGGEGTPPVRELCWASSGSAPTGGRPRTVWPGTSRYADADCSAWRDSRVRT